MLASSTRSTKFLYDAVMRSIQKYPSWWAFARRARCHVVVWYDPNSPTNAVQKYKWIDLPSRACVCACECVCVCALEAFAKRSPVDCGPGRWWPFRSSPPKRKSRSEDAARRFRIIFLFRVFTRTSETAWNGVLLCGAHIHTHTDPRPHTGAHAQPKNHAPRPRNEKRLSPWRNWRANCAVCPKTSCLTCAVKFARLCPPP